MSSHHHRKTGVLTFPPPPGSTPTFQALSQGIVKPSSYSGVPCVHDVSVDSPPQEWRHVLSPKLDPEYDNVSHYDSPSSYQPPQPLPATINQMSPIHTTNRLYLHSYTYNIENKLFYCFFYNMFFLSQILAILLKNL